MAADQQDPEAALTVAISHYWSAHGDEATADRLKEAVAAIRKMHKVHLIHERILAARLHINAAAVERFEVHDDEAAEALMDQPTPDYPGAHDDDMWLRANCGYGIQESGQLMPKPKERRQPVKQETTAPTRGRAVSRLQGDAKRATLPEPDATAAVLLAALLDDPMRLDVHFETLAALPCGRWAILRELMLEQLGASEDHPAVQELRAALRPQEGAARGYSPDGWERAARSLAARWPQG